MSYAEYGFNPASYKSYAWWSYNPYSYIKRIPSSYNYYTPSVSYLKSYKEKEYYSYRYTASYYTPPDTTSYYTSYRLRSYYHIHYRYISYAYYISYYHSYKVSYYMPVECDKSYTTNFPSYKTSYYPLRHSYTVEKKDEKTNSYYTKVEYSDVSSYKFTYYTRGTSYMTSYCLPPDAKKCDNEISYKKNSYSILHPTGSYFELKSYDAAKKTAYVYYMSYSPVASYVT